jgi:hypothetical protein
VNRLPELRASLLDAACREHDRASLLDAACREHDRASLLDAACPEHDRASLLDAACPEHERGAAGTPGPTRDSTPLGGLARAATLVGRRRRRGRHGRHRRRSSPLLVAVAGLLVLAAAALAATRLIGSGAPISLPGSSTLSAHTGPGLVAPGSAHLLALATPDPAGGPPWGMRVLKTTRGLGCVQVGRLLDAQIGALGQDGAFSDDGLFHPLPVAAVSAYSMCQLLDGAGHTFVAVSAHGAAASGVVQDCQKTRIPVPANLPAALRIPLERTVVCPPADLRTLYYGLLGPDARSVTYRSLDGTLHTTPTVGTHGAYLIVLSGETRRTAPGSYFGVATSPSSGIVSVQYRDGHRCVIPPANRLGGSHACPLVGEVPLAAATVTGHDVATPVRASVTPLRAGAHLLHLSFVARVAVHGISTGYHALIFLPRSRGCVGWMDTGTTYADATAGQRVSIEIRIPRGCHGPLTGQVTYAQAVGLSLFQSPLAAGPLVGQVRVTIP